MKDSLYFSHDANARTDEKVLRVRIKYGARGYGIYFMLVECLRNANAYRLQCDYVAIAYELREDAKEIEDIVKNFELFEVRDGFFWSQSLLERMEQMAQKSQKARDSAHARWSKCERNANAPKIDAIKEKKRKEIKVKEISPDALRLSVSLFEKIRKNTPRFLPVADTPEKVQKVCERWADAIEKMIRIEKRDPRTIESVICFVHGGRTPRGITCKPHDFWQPNVLSGDTLRRQFDKLYMQARNVGIIKAGAGEPNIVYGAPPEIKKTPPGLLEKKDPPVGLMARVVAQAEEKSPSQFASVGDVLQKMTAPPTTYADELEARKAAGEPRAQSLTPPNNA